MQGPGEPDSPGRPGIRRARWSDDIANRCAGLRARGVIRCASGCDLLSYGSIWDYQRCGDQEVRYFLILFYSILEALGWEAIGGAKGERDGEEGRDGGGGREADIDGVASLRS